MEKIKAVEISGIKRILCFSGYCHEMLACGAKGRFCNLLAMMAFFSVNAISAQAQAGLRHSSYVRDRLLTLR